jgi:type IV fimbrial biogenesis protein FimT
MRRKGCELRATARRHSGFSLTELVVALAVAMVLLAVGLPAFMRFYHSYQLTNAATQVRDYLRLARYEAIRQNKQVSLQIQPSPGNPGMTVLWVDSNGNGIQDPTEMMTLLGTSGSLVDSGSVPGVTSLVSGASIGSYATNSPSPTSAVMWFDARGAVVPPTSVNMFFLQSSVAPEAGYRAVLLLPAGSMQMWTADTTGNWQQIQ